MAAGIDVYLRGGTYRLSQAFALPASDSGRNGFKVVTPRPGEKRVLSGATNVSGFTIFDSGANIYRASDQLPARRAGSCSSTECGPSALRGHRLAVLRRLPPGRVPQPRPGGKVGHRDGSGQSTGLNVHSRFVLCCHVHCLVTDPEVTLPPLSRTSPVLRLAIEYGYDTPGLVAEYRLPFADVRNRCFDVHQAGRLGQLGGQRRRVGVRRDEIRICRAADLHGSF